MLIRMRAQHDIEETGAVLMAASFSCAVLEPVWITSQSSFFLSCLQGAGLQRSGGLLRAYETLRLNTHGSLSKLAAERRDGRDETKTQQLIDETTTFIGRLLAD